MLLRFIRYVRHQPRAVRNQYALAISATFTLIIACVWVITGLNAGTRDATAGAEEPSSAPFATLWRDIKEQSAAAWSAVAPKGGATTTASSSLDGTLPPGMVADPSDLVLTTETVEAAREKNAPPPVVVPIRVASSSESTPREVQIVTVGSSTMSASGTSTRAE